MVSSYCRFFNKGLSRCTDSLRTHIQGVLVRRPQWENALAGFRVEGAWMSGDWDEVRRIAEDREDTWEMAIARLLLALRASDDGEFASRIATTLQKVCGMHLNATALCDSFRALDHGLLTVTTLQPNPHCRNQYRSVLPPSDSFDLPSHRMVPSATICW